MRSLTDIKGQNLVWRRNKEFKQEYQLITGDPKDPNAEVFAQLLWEKEGGSLARAQFGEHAFTFKRTGFFSHKFTVRVPDSNSDLVSFEPHWSMKGLRGLLQLASGGRYNVEANMWNGNFKWFDTQNNALIAFKNESGWTGLKHTSVEVYRPIEPLGDFGLLLTFGQYLNVLAYNDAMAGAVVSAG
jgi:hypothetical protein